VNARRPTFICDDNLGKLARLLRLGGYDTHFEPNIDNKSLIGVALDEGRIILTRDRELIENSLVREFLLITEDNWPEQLARVRDRYGIRFIRSKMLTRCLIDNTVTEKIPKNEVKDRVYPYTFENFDDFRICPACERTYWAGTHVMAMTRGLSDHGFEVFDDLK
jgi:hypothetical protein